MPAANLILANRGTRRVVIGKGPRSGKDADGKPRAPGKLIKFDTSADEAVPVSKRIGQVHTLTGADAERVRGSKVVEAMRDRLDLKVG